MSDFTLKQAADLPKNPLPIVSIGMGSIVEDAHYPAYKIAGFDVVGGYDANPQQARKMQQKFGVPVLYESVQEAIESAPSNAVFDVGVPGKVILSVLKDIPNGRRWIFTARGSRKPSSEQWRA